MAYTGLGNLGAYLADTHTTPQFELGSLTIQNGNTYRYVQASSAVAAGDFVVMNTGSTNEPNVVLPSSAVNQVIEGMSPIAIAANSYGWIIVEGSMTGAKVAASTAVGAQLGSSATAGTLSTITISASPTQAEVQRTLAAAIGRSAVALDAESGGLAEVRII